MKLSSAVKAIVFAGALAMIGCQEVRRPSPTAASLFLPDLAGIWSGPMTLLSATGGECTGAVVGTFLPTSDRGTITITQSETAASATLTQESTGLACRYTGSSTLTSLAMNAESCDRTGLIVACLNGQNRELRLVGSSVTGSWSGAQLNGQVSTTYNVFTTDQNPVGVGALVATHSFAATRR
jgi:hypothetical protein